jgi:hypothetical protein
LRIIVDIYTAHLTGDITLALRGRIKIAAFQRGVTVADMLRNLQSVGARIHPRPMATPPFSADRKCWPRAASRRGNPLD